ncbi:MAG: NAD-dependent succinate-semialdehyde dehydrogenase [Acidimicrobiia bacterium]|nr:NAD-dependent succinate-semialdehyde dehydrogenase [Acidimicrobiia bacterium]
MDAINPATGEVVATYPGHSLQEARDLVKQTAAAQPAWAALDFADRAKYLTATAQILRQRADELAILIANEMGKPVAQGRAEVEKCAWVSEYYAEHAEAYLASQPAETDASSSYVAFRPLGVVLAVMPWNFPLFQVYRFAAPALMAGNAGVLKHASNVPGCAMAIEEIFTAAGLPDGVFRTLLIGSPLVNEILSMPEVSAVTLTGSTPAGQAVAESAGRMLKKSVLELGGSDPYVILADADLATAAATCAYSRLQNGGQSCIAAKRFIVVEEVRQEFESLLAAEMARVAMGDPLDETTMLGPQARVDLRDELHSQVQASVAAGAELVVGGVVPDGPGAFYPASLLTGVGPGMPAYDEELFGPVAAVIPARDEEDAIRIANDTNFGLGAAVFTQDIERGERIARDQLEAGACFVNAFVKSDPRLPFGGIKMSGFGRELSEFGIREFVNIKTVYVA